MKTKNIRHIASLMLSICLTTMATRAQVGIGTITPDASAILDLSVDNLNSGYKKGFLGPRVALASQTDQVTIPSPASGLLVYNLGTAGLTYVGYVYWNGSEWRALSNVSISKGMVGSITCNGISAIPGTYTKGVPYTGTMMVPYTGGNGGVYEAQTIGPVNGLTATLSAGNFNVGSGTLAYTVTGTPTVTSPNVTSFLLTIGGKSCKADIGIGEGIAPGDLVYYRATMSASPGQVWLSAYVKDLPVIGGKLRLDAYFSSTSNQGGGTTSMSPRLVNVSNKPVKLWFSAMTTVDRFNAGNYLIAPGGNVELDNNIYLGYGFNDILGSSTPRFSDGGETNHQESITVDLSLDDKWYRIYYFPIVDNLNTPGTDDNLRQIYLSIQRLY